MARPCRLTDADRANTSRLRCSTGKIYLFGLSSTALVDLSGTIFSFTARSFPERDKLCNESIVISRSACKVIRRKGMYEGPIKCKRMRD